MKIPIQSGDDHDREERQDASEQNAPGGSGEASSSPASVPFAQEAVPAEAEIRAQDLEAELAQMTKDYHAVREQLLRLAAEFDNYRKRTARQFEEVKQYAATDLVRDLLPALDNLERALDAAGQDSTPSNAILEGVEMVLRQFKRALAKAGVRELQAQGQPFDPALHEAAEVVVVPPREDGMIVEELQRGYMLHDRLLRPAKVMVGKAQKDASGGGT